MSVNEQQVNQAKVNELQSQMSAMQAALEGNSQASLFKPRTFNGFPTEDINEWLSKFETLKTRFSARNLGFLFCQELYARKQGPTEPLSNLTEDIIKKCQRLSLTDAEMMNIFINGLVEDIKSHVILNQPKSFSEAENLARLRDSVRKTSNASSALSVANPQDQKIKELEGQINLLLSIAKQKNSAPDSQPVQAFDPIVLNQQNQQTQRISEFQSMSEIASASMPDFRNKIISKTSYIVCPSLGVACK